jgi:hypothetical protein
MTERDSELQEKSGAVSTTDPLAVLFYVLVKDYLTAKQVEELLEKVQGAMPGAVVFNNGWLGRYAVELKDKLEELREDLEVGQITPRKVDTDDFEIIMPESKAVVLEKADAVLNQLQKTLPPEEFKRVQQEVKDYELEQAFENLMKKEDNGRKS